MTARLDTAAEADAQYAHLCRLREENAALREKLATAEAALAELRGKLVEVVIPLEAVTADAPTQKWIAPEVWAALVKARDTVRALLSPKGDGR